MLLCLVLGACSMAPQRAPMQEPATLPGQAISFAFGGDLAGQNVCRDEALGFPIFEHILQSQPAFFIGLGDMIYADSACEAVGLYGNAQIPRASQIATTPEEFRAHWNYVGDDPGFGRLLREVPYFAVWDDHEVRNDFGPRDDLAVGSTDLHLMPAGRAAFKAFGKSHGDTLYFSHRSGSELEIFFLDTRSYRDLNSAADNPAHPKTMLGGAQREWLVERCPRIERALEDHREQRTFVHPHRLAGGKGPRRLGQL